nr:hypothetical protein [Tanacetum cinerariifolium]
RLPAPHGSHHSRLQHHPSSSHRLSANRDYAQPPRFALRATAAIATDSAPGKNSGDAGVHVMASQPRRRCDADLASYQTA